MALRCFEWVDLQQSQVEIAAIRTHGLSLVDEARRGQVCRRARGRQGRALREARKIGPSLTAPPLVGSGAERVGTEGWAPLGGTNRRMAQGRKRDDLLSGYPLGIARRRKFFPRSCASVVSPTLNFGPLFTLRPLAALLRALENPRRI